MNRNGTRQSAQALAEWLVAVETSAHSILPEDRMATCRVCEKLRRPLSHLTGPAGYRSLLARALTLAQRDTTKFVGAWVTDTGALEGLLGEVAELSPLLVAHLIELLTTFIGESLTLRLLHDIWPALPVQESQLMRKEVV